MCSQYVWVVWDNKGGAQEVLQMRWVGESINKAAAMPDMPKPNKRSWKDTGRTLRASSSKEHREKKVENQFQHYSSNLESDQGQEHGFQA